MGDAVVLEDLVLVLLLAPKTVSPMAIRTSLEELASGLDSMYLDRRD